MLFQLENPGFSILHCHLVIGAGHGKSEIFTNFFGNGFPSSILVRARGGDKFPNKCQDHILGSLDTVLGEGGL